MSAAELNQARKQLEELKGKLEKIREEQNEKNALPSANRSKAGGNLNMQPRRILKGHFGKIYSMQWGPDSRHVVSASQDGKLIIWNAYTTNKVHAIPLRSSWVMTCDFSSSGNLVACGGLDNICSVYKVPQGKEAENQRITPSELAQHEGYLSCCRFINSDAEMITSSGDSTCILWDVETQVVKATFDQHTSDVMSISAYGSTFVSGSCDATAKLWDYRASQGKKSAMICTFPGHESDINSVDFFPGGNAFTTGSDDSSCRLFDVRAFGQLGRYADDKILCGITSVSFSGAGRYLFAGYDDHNVHVWDTQTCSMAATLSGHENRVSCVDVAPDGKALCTGSWDQLLKIWA
jgi:guanine nucleotide-binding protein G(I)/G(S)/G(T) subunit beta-1